MPTALSTIFDEVRWQVDRQKGGRLQNTDLVPVANLVYKEVWDLILESFGERFVKDTPNFVLVGNTEAQSNIDLTTGKDGTGALIGGPAADFYDLNTSENRWAVQQLSQDSVHWIDIPPYRREQYRLSYHLQDTLLFFEPYEYAIGTFRVHYVYMPVSFVDSTSTIVDFNGWVERYLIDVLCARFRDRDEEDPNTLLNLRSDLVKRIRTRAASHGGPRRVLDVRNRRRIPPFAWPPYWK